MSFDEITIGDAKRKLAEADELRAFLGHEKTTAPTDEFGWEIGANYFIRTVTHHIVGKLEAVTEHELWIRDGAWVADDGRFHECLRDGKVNEVEPFPEGELIPVGRGALIDACPWRHALLREVK